MKFWNKELKYASIILVVILAVLVWLLFDRGPICTYKKTWRTGMPIEEPDQCREGLVPRV